MSTAVDGIRPTLISVAGKEARSRPGTGLDDVVPLFAALQGACKSIASLVRRSGIEGATGKVWGGGKNAGGDSQTKIDVVSNDILKSYLEESGVVQVLASEEEDEPVKLNDNSKYVVVFDPLDGSSNIDASIPTGTIFGIYLADPTKNAVENALQSGKKLVAGGYCLYSSSTVWLG
ncbi:unnamed protein product [Discosporangium mesarthrocarpum]